MSKRGNKTVIALFWINFIIVRSYPLADVTADNLVCVVCALVQVCIDPVYRTKRGLCQLLSKEFSAKGYEFGRNHYAIDNESNTKQSETEPNFMVSLLLEKACQFVYELFSLFLAITHRALSPQMHVT